MTRYLAVVALESDRPLSTEEQVQITTEINDLLAKFKPVSVTVTEVAS